MSDNEEPNNFLELRPAKEVAAEFGYTADYVSKLAREGKIVGQKVNGSWLVQEASLRIFFDQVQAEKEARKRELSDMRHEEYRMSQATAAPKPASSRNIFAVTFARTVAAAVGAFVFLFSFTVGYSLSATVVSSITDTVAARYLSSGELLNDFSSSLFTGYITFIEHTLPNTPIAYEQFTDHLASLWIDRELVMEELDADRHALQSSLLHAYSALGVNVRNAVTTSLSWYEESVVHVLASGIGSSAEWLQTSGTNGAFEVRNTAVEGVSRAALGAVSFSGDTSLAFSWNPLSWVSSLFNTDGNAVDVPPTVIIREESQAPAVPTVTPVGTIPTRVVRNVTEAITVSGVSESQLALQLQILRVLL